jgi:hypothetical protein
MGGRVCRRTIRRAIRKVWGRKWRSMQWIPISKETAAKQLSFAEGWLPDIIELIEVCVF